MQKANLSVLARGLWRGWAARPGHVLDRRRDSEVGRLWPREPLTSMGRKRREADVAAVRLALRGSVMLGVGGETRKGSKAPGNGEGRGVLGS